MQTPKEVLKIFEKYSPRIDKELKELLNSQENYGMYDMMHYFFGYKNEEFKQIKIYGGKRYRSGLCMLIADLYGSADKALEVAAAVELFHNFTLIHDDIEDMDPMRRGRPTVWKLWGINHGINTGDAQLLLTNLELIKVAEKYPKVGVRVQRFLNKKYLEVLEGQFLDFTLTDLHLGNPFVTQDNYLKMIQKKTSVLVGTATKGAGMVLDLPKKEVDLLWKFGLNLGLAYQVCDDMVSIWGSPKITGKLAANDLYEKKKTLPVLYAFNQLKKSQQQKFKNTYNQKVRLGEPKVKEIMKILNDSGAYDYSWEKVCYYADRAKGSVKQLSIPTEKKKILFSVIEALLPNIKEICK